MRASRDRSTPRSPSASDAGTPACAPPPDRSGIATTTPCAKASSRPSNANCSSAGGSGLTPKRGWPSSSSSRAGTIRDGATPPSDICHPSTTNGASYPPLAQIHNRPRNRVNSSGSKSERLSFAQPSIPQTSGPSWSAWSEPSSWSLSYITPQNCTPNNRISPFRQGDAIGECVEPCHLCCRAIPVVSVARIAPHCAEGVDTAILLADFQVDREAARLERFVSLRGHRTRSPVSMRRDAAECERTFLGRSPNPRRWPRRYTSAVRRCYSREHKPSAIFGAAFKSSRLESASARNRLPPR